MGQEGIIKKPGEKANVLKKGNTQGHNGRKRKAKRLQKVRLAQFPVDYISNPLILYCVLLFDSFLLLLMCLTVSFQHNLHLL